MNAPTSITVTPVKGGFDPVVNLSSASMVAVVRRSSARSAPVGHCVAKRADTGDFDFDDVTGHHRTYPGRTAGQQHIPGLECDPSSDERQQLAYPEHHVRGRSFLDDLAAEPRGDLQRRRIGYVGLDPRTHWAEGVGALRAVPLSVVTPVVRSDVVRAGVAEHEVRGTIGLHVAGGAADDDGQLALVLQSPHL